MTTPESRVKDRVKKLLRERHIYWHCPVQNGMGSPSLDFICCVRGYYLAIETKAPGKKPTPRQELTMAAITQANGFVFVVATDDDLLWLESYLDLLASMDLDKLKAHVALHT